MYIIYMYRLCHAMSVLYQVYNHRAWGWGDYKPDIAQVDIYKINIFHDLKSLFIQLKEATNHTVHVSNHGACSTFIALSEALKGVFIMTYIYNIYIYICTCYVCVCHMYVCALHVHWCICSMQSGNLRNLQIALCKLKIHWMCANQHVFCRLHNTNCSICRLCSWTTNPSLILHCSEDSLWCSVYSP